MHNTISYVQDFPRTWMRRWMKDRREKSGFSVDKSAGDRDSVESNDLQNRITADRGRSSRWDSWRERKARLRQMSGRLTAEDREARLQQMSVRQRERHATESSHVPRQLEKQMPGHIINFELFPAWRLRSAMKEMFLSWNEISCSLIFASEFPK